MARRDLLRLIVGFRNFRKKYFEPENGIYQRLAAGGQSPKTLVIACSDSRVDPAIVMSASPGELFVVRNVANLVPPYESTLGLHGVSSSIEFAVTTLKVDTILIMGHRQCGGIRALMTSEAQNKAMPGTFVGAWMSIARAAAQSAIGQLGASADFEVLCKDCEMKSIVASLQNLRTFPFVQEAVTERGISLIGAYFDLERGEMFSYSDESGEFQPISL